MLDGAVLRKRIAELCKNISENAYRFPSDELSTAIIGNLQLINSRCIQESGILYNGIRKCLGAIVKLLTDDMELRDTDVEYRVMGFVCELGISCDLYAIHHSATTPSQYILAKVLLPLDARKEILQYINDCKEIVNNPDLFDNTIPVMSLPPNAHEQYMVRFGIFSRLDLLNGYLVKNRETDDATIREYFTDTSDTLDETTEIDPEIRAGVEAAWSLYQDARQQMESQQQSVSAYTDDIANAILAMSEVIQGCISGDGTVNTMRLNEQMAVFAPFEADASLQNTQIGRRIHLLKGSLDAILQDSSVAFINATVRYTFA